LTLRKPLNALYFKEVGGVLQTPAARGLYPVHSLGAFGRPGSDLTPKFFHHTDRTVTNSL